MPLTVSSGSFEVKIVPVFVKDRNDGTDPASFSNQETIIPPGTVQTINIEFFNDAVNDSILRCFDGDFGATYFIRVDAYIKVNGEWVFWKRIDDCSHEFKVW